MTWDVDHFSTACDTVERALGRHLEADELAKMVILTRGGVRLEDWRHAIDESRPATPGFASLLWAVLTISAASDRWDGRGALVSASWLVQPRQPAPLGRRPRTSGQRARGGGDPAAGPPVGPSTLITSSPGHRPRTASAQR